MNPPAQLILRAINAAKSAYLAIRIAGAAFDVYRVPVTLQTGIYAKARVAGACVRFGPHGKLRFECQTS